MMIAVQVCEIADHDNSYYCSWAHKLMETAQVFAEDSTVNFEPAYFHSTLFDVVQLLQSIVIDDSLVTALVRNLN